MRSISVFLLACLPVSYAGAQSALATPILGFAYDASRMAIRPVRGFPGAAILGDPIDAGFDVALAAISPRQDYALAVSAGDGRVYVLRFPNGQPSVAALDNAMASPTQIVFSPSGTAALLYDQTSGRLQTVVGQDRKSVV